MVQGRHLWKMPVLGKLLRSWHRFRRWISRNEWGTAARSACRASEGTAAEPGIVLVQIDGFSQSQLERALRRGRMPFLRKLMAREHYRSAHALLRPAGHHAGRAGRAVLRRASRSCRRSAFASSETGKAVWMIDPEEAARVQQRLIRRRRSGLLEGGSSYSNIYTGGAAEPHFCASVMGWGDLLRNARPGAILLFALVNIAPLIRAFCCALVEVLIGAGRCDLRHRPRAACAARVPHDPRRAWPSECCCAI